MHDDDECEHEGECEGLDAKFSGWDLVVAFFNFAHGVCQAATTSFEFLLKSSIGAANRQVRLETFADEARADIEALPVKGDE